jgi:hypothetical protein
MTHAPREASGPAWFFMRPVEGKGTLPFFFLSAAPQGAAEEGA